MRLSILTIPAAALALSMTFSCGSKKADEASGKDDATRALTAEALDNVEKIYKGAAAYFMAPKVNPEAPDELLPCSFPDSVACTPKPTACVDGKRTAHPPSEPATWDAPSWAALSFEMVDKHYYQYCFTNNGDSATVTAIGDLDCDGVKSKYTMILIPASDSTASECKLQTGSSMTKENPFE